MTEKKVFMPDSSLHFFDFWEQQRRVPLRKPEINAVDAFHNMLSHNVSAALKSPDAQTFTIRNDSSTRYRRCITLETPFGRVELDSHRVDFPKTSNFVTWCKIIRAFGITSKYTSGIWHSSYSKDSSPLDNEGAKNYLSLFVNTYTSKPNIFDDTRLKVGAAIVGYAGVEFQLPNGEMVTF